MYHDSAAIYVNCRSPRSVCTVMRTDLRGLAGVSEGAIVSAMAGLCSRAGSRSMLPRMKQ
jgi:hypothetical protein